MLILWKCNNIAENRYFRKNRQNWRELRNPCSQNFSHEIKVQAICILFIVNLVSEISSIYVSLIRTQRNSISHSNSQLRLINCAFLSIKAIIISLLLPLVLVATLLLHIKGFLASSLNLHQSQIDKQSLFWARDFLGKKISFCGTGTYIIYFTK